MASSSRCPLATFRAPLPLLETDEQGRFQMVEATARALEAITQPVVVVAIVGKYRTGKSFLMNRLAGTKTGFSLGSTVQSHTKGIWVWPRPHPLQENKCLLLLDTEGLGDVEQAGTSHDMWLFVMATLLSTVLVQNVTGTLGKEGMEQLHFVLNMTEHVKTKIHQDNDCLGLDFHHYFPDLVICVRDFTLELVVNGADQTPDQYMKYCLEMRKPGKSKECREFNEQRDLLCNYFQTRKCFIFPTPADGGNLKIIERLSDAQLDPRFMQTANEFTNYIFKKGKTKSIDGAVISGQSFVKLVEQYASAQREGTVPCIESALVQVVTLANLRAKDAALALYRERIGLVAERLPLSTQELNAWHQQAVDAAVALFHDRSVLDKERTHEKQLMMSLGDEYNQLYRQNKETSTKKCEQRLEELYQPIKVKVQEGAFCQPGGFQQYQASMEKLQADYRRTPGLGEQMIGILSDFLKDKESEKHNLLILDKTITDAEKERLEREENNKQLAREKEALEEKQAQQDAQLKALKEQLEANAEEYEKKLESKEQSMALKLEDATSKCNRFQEFVEAVMPILKQGTEFYLMRSALIRK